MECGLYIVKGGNSKHKNIVKFTIFRPGPKNFLLRSVNFLGPGLSHFVIKNFFPPNNLDVSVNQHYNT